MKRFVLVTMVVVLLMSMSVSLSTIAFADGTPESGDVYYLNPANWPTKHWALMTNEEVTAYEAAGWEKCVGVLWYDKFWNVIDISHIDINKIPQLYNQNEYTLNVLYTWICPASPLNKYQEQSVSVGTWTLSSEQAVAYYNNGFKVPEIPDIAVEPTFHFMTQGYYEGKACGQPDDSMDLSKFVCVRYIFELYDLKYGSKLYLRSGEQVSYTYDEILNGLDNEIPWHSWQ